MHEITVTTAFSAAHALRLPDGSLEPVHGHDWKLTLRVASEGLDAMGAVMDFHELQRLVDAAVARWRNADLNTLPPFAAGVAAGDDGCGIGSLDPPPGRAWNPTAERVAQEVAVRVAPGLPAGVRMRSVSVTEAVGCTARFTPAYASDAAP
ncbi:6-pyruvoyl trahydropterin synthase family protein [Phycisphaera mikurensis]|uniref:6-carboxy-5,6,7,8-tetrahydropterin synthase n=1 Tax=Phycisphaera mikurensis (strain NBRC 102666 / KCTC 22515 / FYK2301M01) TaxID=1142394 RepID=I0IEL7_PHYMF|nr:6-carboxytetrahydropterin synthase [Phycisphaera mikurensis]MBB6441503.1 6-pyruvoyltetrahydropterin/6-carboxytetrahydropterin synthase [Phycisphaera mikurensis]BAM03705.1 6-pyruvoyl tetrahydropterin synthase family protein [Phycisphaera mikurensis NBRC 102666]